MRKNIDVTQKPTSEQLAMLAKAAEFPNAFDAEYPELTETELRQFKKISAECKINRQKQTVTLRLSPQALSRAKSLGKGYTSVLSRILESALKNADVLQHYL